MSSLDSHHVSRVLLAFCTSRPGVEHTPVLMGYESSGAPTTTSFFQAARFGKGKKVYLLPFSPGPGFHTQHFYFSLIGNT